ncbi:MAG: hypothetical protein QXN71_02110 [Candidatus Aenigmatarchaeota archaeon]
MLEYWFWVTAPLAVFTAIGLLIYKMGRYPSKKEPGKEEAYTCGEPIPDINVRADNFYQSIKRSFRLRKIQHIHTGDINDYVLWLVLGLVVLIVLVAVI